MKSWLVPTSLLVLGALPIIAGALRLTQLSGASDIMPANPRFGAMPLPVVVHIVSATAFAILGPFQFAAGFRRRRRGWHRAAGRLLVLSGLLIGLTGLWMTLFYARPDGSGGLLYAERLVFGSAMVVSLVLGVTAIMSRNIGSHRAWMTRAYAIGLGAATQMLILMIGEMIAGPPTELAHDLLMGAAWVINLAVAEWAIRAAPVLTASSRRHYRVALPGHWSKFNARNVLVDPTRPAPTGRRAVRRRDARVAP